MAKRKLPRLSAAQLELMNILWDEGEASVTEVWKALPRSRRVARTTVMTVLVRLTERGWLRRRKSGKEFLYSALVSREEAMGGVLSRMADTVFGGSAESLVEALVTARGISREEAKHLRRIIDESAGGSK